LTGCCASLLTGVFKNAFVDAPTSGPDDVTEQQRLLAQTTGALVILWMGANALIKLTVLFFYRRIFIGKWFNICSLSLIALSVVWFVYAILSWLFYCGTHFKEDVEGGWLVCPLWGFEIQMGVFALDSFIDFCLLVLPMPFVWKLHLDLKKKLALCIVFLLGGFAFVAGLNNTVIQLVYLTNPTLAKDGGSGNFFQGSSLLFSNWPAIEIGVGLIACNLPSLSFRAISAFPAALRRGISLSLSGIRHAGAIITLRSGSRRGSSTRSRRSPYQTNAEPSGEAGLTKLTNGNEASSGKGSISAKGSLSGKSDAEEIQLETITRGLSSSSRGFDAV